jgi:hypothetical protein
MIKEIHCFGTSHTAGGGFEFFNENYSPILKKFYKEQPYTQFNYSWPGQLQKILNNNIKVFNHAKAGYGNERMYRISYDIIMKGANKDKLFIFEFSSVGRKEYWSNTFNDYFICNYGFEMDKNIPITKIKLNGIAGTYGLNDYEYSKKLITIVSPFIDETMNYDVQNNIYKMNNEFFIDFLIKKNINFYYISNPHYSNINLINSNYITFLNDCHFLKYIIDKKLTIFDETNGEIKDYHSGLEGHNKVAKLVKNKIKEKYEINS